MAGFPHHQLENYLQKLLRPDIASRCATRWKIPPRPRAWSPRSHGVVTPGTVTEDNLLDPRQNNHRRCWSRWAWTVSAWPGWSYRPGCFMPPTSRPTRGCTMNSPAWRRRNASRRKDRRHGGAFLQRLAWCACTDGGPTGTSSTLPPAGRYDHFHVTTLSGFGFDDQPRLSAAGALLLYVQEMLKTDVSHLRQLKPYVSSQVLQLDDCTRRSLELTRTPRTAAAPVRC